MKSVRIRIACGCVFALVGACNERSGTEIQGGRSAQQPTADATTNTQRSSHKFDLLDSTPESLVEMEQQLSMVRNLGKEGQVEAIPALMRNLFRIQPYSSDSSSMLEMYPCAAALIEIGQPAVEAILDELTKKTTELERLVLAQTLVEIEGPIKASNSLESITSVAEDPTLKKGLLEITKHVKSYQ